MENERLWPKTNKFFDSFVCIMLSGRAKLRKMEKWKKLAEAQTLNVI